MSDGFRKEGNDRFPDGHIHSQRALPEGKMKIVSGGQTGVDRAALDAAMESGVETGGWCPKGRIAEDGIIPAKYPVQELARAGYKVRTKQNVVDSDGTVIIYFGTLSGGTEQTLLFCIREKKPYVLIDGEEFKIESAVKKIKGFVDHNSISVLNAAGPRASKEPRAYGYTKEVLLRFLKDYAEKCE